MAKIEARHVDGKLVSWEFWKSWNLEDLMLGGGETRENVVQPVFRAFGKVIRRVDDLPGHGKWVKPTELSEIRCGG